MHLDPSEIRQVEVASRALDLIPSNAHIAAVFDAIRTCVPVAAGLFSIIRPGADDALVSQPVGLPSEVFESWLRMPPELLQMTLNPVVTSGPGRLWRDSETLRGAQRKQLEVLRELDLASLGEGAGYKLVERPVPWYRCVEHLMLALIMARGERVPPRADVMLERLHRPIQAAVLRLALPLLAHQPIFPQLVAEQSLGYICLSLGGGVLEVNRRAYHLVERYSEEASIQGRRGAVAEFAARAREHAVKGMPWQLRSNESPSILQVDVHRLVKETHVLPEDTILLIMREVPEPPVIVGALSALDDLTNRERQIAFIATRSGRGEKQIAADLKISEGTVRKHMERIHKKLRVQSRAELIMLLNKR